MRAAWHLAISNLAGRRLRSALLVLAVALAVALVVAVACAMDTVQGSIRQALGQMVGLADLRIAHRFSSRLDQGLLEQVRQWPQVRIAAARFETGMTLRLERTGKRATVQAQGVEPDLDLQINPLNLVAGRAVRDAGEVALDHQVARALDAQVGDVLDVVKFGDPLQLTVVGIIQRPPLGVLQRPLAMMQLAQAQQMAGLPGVVDEVLVQLHDPRDVEHVEQHAQLPPQAMFHTSASTSVNLNRSIRASRLVLFLLTVLVFLSAGFIILTSLTTAVTERLRELAILRCIGAARRQIAAAQVLSGLMLGVAGAALGTPLGIAMAYWLYWRHAAVLKGGFLISAPNLALAIGAALLAGVLGAACPALAAARVQPLQALAARARRPRRWTVLACLPLGLALAALAPILLHLPLGVDRQFYLYVYAALPLVFLGYFLLSVPLLAALGRWVAPALSRLLALPATVLSQSVLATPFRHGFTAGTLMVSLAMLVALWSGGRNVTSAWFRDVKMPDAFVHSFFSLTHAQWEALRQVPAIEAACPTTAFPVRVLNVQLGVSDLSPRTALFVSFDPASFFQMTQLQWVQGDPQTALQRLEQGNAVLVSQEYLQARGIGVGSRLELETLEGPVAFEVVGVVASPGLNVAVQFFGIQRAYGDASLSSVFGTRADSIRYFGVDSINLVLLSLHEDVSDREALRQIREAAPGTVADSSRQIRRIIAGASRDFLKVASTIALGTLLVACVGVGNLILAGLEARRFEYGVLRAIGAPRGVLARLILGETLLTALAGGVAGIALGGQIAWMGHLLHRRLVGLVYPPSIAWDVSLWGALVVLGMALLAALPAVVRLLRTPPRELLAGD